MSTSPLPPLSVSEALDKGEVLAGAPYPAMPLRRDRRLVVGDDVISINGVAVWRAREGGWLTPDERVRRFAERMAQDAIAEEVERKAREAHLAGEKISKAEHDRALAVVDEYALRAGQTVLGLLAVAAGATALVSALAGWI